MHTHDQILENPQFALQFLLEANIISDHGIEDTPIEYIDRQLLLIQKLNDTTKRSVLNENKVAIKEKRHNKGSLLKREWKHKSVVRFINETENRDPIDEIKLKARKVVLHALQNGWSGPPFSAIELAKILKFEITPNDKILDARIISPAPGSFQIEYNPFQKPTRMNFSIAHEIIHTFFSDCHEAIRNREDSPEENRELEQLCNMGAAELQLPYVVFPNDANQIQAVTLESLIDLAQKYKASLESTFIGFVLAIDKPCALLICTFVDNETLTADYAKKSIKFNRNIPEKFTIPRNSRAYYCASPGTTERETISWDFLGEPYDAFYVGLSPMRQENKGRLGIILVPNDGRGYLQNRKISIEVGDATKPRADGVKIIAQVVNTSGGLGIGFGKSLAKNYPIVKESLKLWKENKLLFRLGESQLVRAKEDVYIFQMLAQKGLFAKNGKIPLDYQCLQTCLANLREEAIRLNASVHMPLIGAGQAKGKWEIIEGLIYSELVNMGVKVNIYLFGTKRPEDFNPKSSLSLFNEQSTWLKEK